MKLRFHKSNTWEEMKVLDMLDWNSDDTPTDRWLLYWVGSMYSFTEDLTQRPENHLAGCLRGAGDWPLQVLPRDNRVAHPLGSFREVGGVRRGGGSFES